MEGFSNIKFSRSTMMMPYIISLPEVIQKWIVQLLYALWEISLNRVIIQTSMHLGKKVLSISTNSELLIFCL